jgi:hypothetical protein
MLSLATCPGEENMLEYIFCNNANNSGFPFRLESSSLYFVSLLEVEVEVEKGK